jgi:hypothetical protein
MLNIMLMWFLALFLFGSGIWYIRAGYHYGFVKQKFLKHRFRIGDEDDDYVYGARAKNMGASQIIIGLFFIFVSIVLIYDHYF